MSGINELSTPSDLITLIIFAGLVVLFLQRSTEEVPQDRIIHYAPPAIGCAVANYLGNHHQEIIAVIIILAVIAYTLYVLKPFKQKP